VTRRSGLPVARPAAERYDPDGRLSAPDGTVPLDRVPVARRLAASMATTPGPDGASAPVNAGELNALGLLHDVFHELIERYEAEARPGAFRDALAALAEDRGDDRAAEVLRSYDHRYVGSPDERHALVEELLLTRVANENPAAEPLRILVDDRPLAHGTDYPAAVGSLERFFAAQPPFGPDGETLVDLLRAPALASPTSLAGQLRYVRDRWGSLVPGLMDRLGVGLGVIAEEERGMHLRFGGGVQGGAGGGGDGGGPGRAEVPSLGGLEDEPERFSHDSDWMPRLVLIAKSTYVWLDQLSREDGRDIRTLDAIPDEELDRLASSGVTGLWLIGLWQRSIASERIKRMRGNPDAVASAYSLDDYRIADDLGGETAFEQLRGRAWARGIRLATDMVPNHMGIDSRWVIEHPEWFVALPESPYPGYTFDGPDLSADERVGIFLEDHYWDNSDAAVVFKRLDRGSGATRYVYHGNDGTSFPWNDTAQLDFLKAEVREQVIRTILDVARRSPVIRFDAAMVLARKHVRRLWYPEPGSAGAIPSRAEHGSLPPAEFDAAMPAEFWREVVDRVAAEVPDTLLLAEAFWLLEGYFVRTLGMHRVYNSAFMHMLRDEDNAGYRRVIGETLEFDQAILQRYVNFMSNPDEATAVEQFGKGDKYFGVATLLATLPGLPMLGHGQVEGFGEKYGMEFRRATLDERPDPWLVERHEREIFPLLRRRGWFAGADDFALYDFATDAGAVDEHVFAYSNGRGPTRSLVVYHNRFGSTAGRIRNAVPSATKGADGSKTVRRRTLVEGLDLAGAGPGALVAFRDAAGGLEFLRAVADLRDGLHLRLDAYARHVFWEFRELPDPTGVWRRVHDRLEGRGVPSIEEALREVELEPVFATARAALAAGADDAAVEVFLRAVATATGTGTGKGTTDTVAATIRGRRIALATMRPASGSSRSDPLAAVRPALADAWHLAVLDAWSVLEPLGRLAPAGLTGDTSRAWLDELRLAPLVAAALRQRGLDEGAAWSAVERVRVLLALPRPSNAGGRSTADRERRIVAAWLEAAPTRVFLRVNRWQDAEWFDRDAWRELADWALLLDAGDIAADDMLADAPRRRALAASASVVRALIKHADAAGYRVDRLRALVAPARPATRTVRPGSAARE